MSIVDKAFQEILSGSLSMMEQIGRAGLHALSPNDFEYYLCSFELLDSMGNTKAFMSFPIMPNNLVETTPHPIQITKTTSGNTILFNSSFPVKDISLQGTFGRKLRVLTGQKDIDAESKIPFFSQINMGVLGDSPIIKSGYGLCKMLQRIVDQSTALDSVGKPHLLIFSNFAFGTRYIVEVLSDSYLQSTENNVIWYYNLEMKAVANAQLSDLARQSKTDKSFLGQVTNAALSKELTDLLASVRDYTLGVSIT